MVWSIIECICYLYEGITKEPPNPPIIPIKINGVWEAAPDEKKKLHKKAVTPINRPTVFEVLVIA